MTIQAVIFLLGSIGFILLSRQAFANKRSHGFPRFFAFEAILGLVVLNTPYWLVQPFSSLQVISWALLVVSIFPVVSAVVALRRFGAPETTTQDDGRIAFEKTTHLVTQGPYRFIRHPMYASLLYFSLGVLLKRVDLTTTLLTIIAFLALFLTAAYEESENLRIFGEAYAVYMKRTRRFIPFVF